MDAGPECDSVKGTGRERVMGWWRSDSGQLGSALLPVDYPRNVSVLSGVLLRLRLRRGVERCGEGTREVSEGRHRLLLTAEIQYHIMLE